MNSKMLYTVYALFKGSGWCSHVVDATDTTTAAEKALNRVFNERGYDTVSDIDCCMVEIDDLMYGYDVIVHGDENGVYYEISEMHNIY